jgi:hypothetical protein
MFIGDKGTSNESVEENKSHILYAVHLFFHNSYVS